MDKKNLIKRAFSFAVAAMVSAGCAISAWGANDNMPTVSAAAITSSAQAVVTALANTDNSATLHIEQQIITLDELKASDYKVSVRVYSTQAENGISCWNSKYLCYADCAPDGYDEIWLDNDVLCGESMTFDKKTGISSEDFNLTVGALTNNPAGIVQVNGYSSETVQPNAETGEITLFTLTFTLPEKTCGGDIFNLMWWDEKNAEGQNSAVYSDFESYDTQYENGFIMVINTGDTPDDECIDTFSTEGFLGYYYADNRTELELQDYTVLALFYDGSIIDVSDDCALKSQISPYELYWDSYNSDNPAFNYTLDVVYCGNDSNIIAFCEKYGYTVGSVSLTIGQRGDANLDHAANNFDTAEISEYIADMQEYKTAIAFGQPAEMPLLCAGNKLSAFLADCSGDSEIATQDSAMLTQWEALSTRYSISQSLAGAPVAANELCTLWEQLF